MVGFPAPPIFSSRRQTPQQPATETLISSSELSDTASITFSTHPPAGPVPHGTDQFVRAPVASRGGSQRAAIIAETDIKKVNKKAHSLANPPVLEKAKTNIKVALDKIPHIEVGSRPDYLSERKSGPDLGKTTAALDALFEDEDGEDSEGSIFLGQVTESEDEEDEELHHNPWGSKHSWTKTSIVLVRERFVLDFPGGANLVQCSPDLGIASAFMAITQSMSLKRQFPNDPLSSPRAVKPPTLQELNAAHDQYIQELCRRQEVDAAGNSSPDSSEVLLLTPNLLAAVIHSWGQSQEPPLNLSLGIVSEDEVENGSHTGLLLSVSPYQNQAGPVIVVWIFHESSSTGGFDPDTNAFTSRAQFRALKPAQFGLAGIRRLSFMSKEQIVPTMASTDYYSRGGSGRGGGDEELLEFHRHLYARELNKLKIETPGIKVE
ncbi:hypothetical protein B0H63DRAFT_551260 [Podospora didyma]|uniref:Uncharacterized protein n=1 Tax=Podospora didyma TaxID=330526 RepID=A0AAE0KAI7_9PEZI|nr:hypothetical protein B0H63DRAFT_551260 [Podospora didyma]